ncbi:MAG: DNA replication and repair protein RecF, partial [Clostridia bacterium]|nr:DNA replication and repair protein RecF [Clostridia bacterium]
MLVKKLNLKNFRNIKKASLEFDPKINVISGENAQGKTNMLESIWLFCGAKSFRYSKDSSLVLFGEKKGEAEIEFISGEISHTAKIKLGEEKTAELDGKALKRVSSLAGIFGAVIFSPADLSLVSGGPDKRRRFLDLSIGQLYPNYIEILREYSRAVMQRNKIIKEYKYDPSVSIMLDVFEAEIAEKGKKITEFRKRFLERLCRFVPDIYFGLSGGRENIETVYVSAASPDSLKQALKEARRQDSILGVTSAGPHRDDLELKINGISARAYGSQGQKRSIAIALKLASLSVFGD